MTHIRPFATSYRLPISGRSFNREDGPVVTVQRRAALRLDRTRLIEDLLVPLRRQFPAG